MSQLTLDWLRQAGGADGYPEGVHFYSQDARLDALVRKTEGPR